ncbi:MAG: DNA mismatch repair endonuclease MutL [Terriglobales bacterium]
MGRIHVLPEHVANKIAAGEVVERPASVVKELLENALDAGARRVRVQVEAGGKKLIQITDDGCGMVRDDALLAFERHATSKLKNADDLLRIGTLGFRGEALPSIASVSRLRLETCAALEFDNPPHRSNIGSVESGATAGSIAGDVASYVSTGDSLSAKAGTVIEIAGGKILRVEDAGLPVGTSVTVRDLFFNIPARKKFLKSEATELGHIASLVTHYALAHPDKHFELHSATNAVLIAAPVANHADRIYQVFGRETLNELLPLAAALPLERSALPPRSPWTKRGEGEASQSCDPGEFRLHGFISKPEIQKLNRNSIFVFVNGRLIRDRLVQHALTEAYRNILPPTLFPVVLLFLELPFTEVDVNVHPSKTEVRFRQQSVVHDFVRDSVRAALMKARPVPQFTREISAQPSAAPGLTPGAQAFGAKETRDVASYVSTNSGPAPHGITQADVDFALKSASLPPRNQSLCFEGAPLEVEANAAVPVARFPRQTFEGEVSEVSEVANSISDYSQTSADTFAGLKPLGQIRDSFILAVNDEGLWIIDQHVAHERVLFEKVLRQRAAERVESQRLLMPLVVELTPGQQAVFAEICDELQRNGFDVEPFGSRTIAVKTAPAGVEASDIEHMLHELLEQFEREQQALNLSIIRREIAASIACHAAIKVNTPLAPDKMEWLLRELSRTECPMSCPHGRPVMLRYSVRDIERAFKRT